MVLDDSQTQCDILRDQLAITAKSVAANNGTLDLLYADRAAANSAIDVLRAAGHPIESLAATRSTLEEIFMETVQSGKTQ